MAGGSSRLVLGLVVAALVLCLACPTALAVDEQGYVAKVASQAADLTQDKQAEFVARGGASRRKLSDATSPMAGIAPMEGLLVGSALKNKVIDFDALDYNDCGTYMCPLQSSIAASYIVEGCLGAFSDYYQALELDAITDSMSESSGVSTAVLVLLSGGCGLFSLFAGFLLGYKTSPTFAYQRVDTFSK